MSASEVLWESVKSFLKTLPLNGNSNFKKIHVFLKSSKCYQTGSLVYILVPNMIVKQYLEKPEFLNVMENAFNECSHTQCSVNIEIAKNFSVAKLKKNPSVSNVSQPLPNNVQKPVASPKLPKNKEVTVSQHLDNAINSQPTIATNVKVAKNSNSAVTTQTLVVNTSSQAVDNSVAKEVVDNSVTKEVVDNSVAKEVVDNSATKEVVDNSNKHIASENSKKRTKKSSVTDNSRDATTKNVKKNTTVNTSKGSSIENELVAGTDVVGTDISNANEQTTIASDPLSSAMAGYYTSMENSSSEHSNGSSANSDVKTEALINPVPIEHPNHVSKGDGERVDSFQILTKEELKSNCFFKQNSIDKSKRFDNFIEGPTNFTLCNSGKLVSEQPGCVERNPFFIYGESGLGKTHILYAIGNEILKQKKELRIMYINMNTFINDYYIAIQDYYNSRANRSTKLTEFKTLYRNLDVLLIDDVQELHLKPQNMSKSVINILTEIIVDIEKTHCQLVFASNMHPQAMSTIDGRLRNRFQAGVCIKVEPPDYETRRSIVSTKAGEAGLTLDGASIEFISRKFQTNVRTIEGYMKTIAACVINKHDKVTIGFVKNVLSDVLAGKEKLLTVDNIKKTVADYYKITVNDIDSSARPVAIAHPRMMAMYLAREFTNKSFPMLGKEFGGRDHSTIINAKKKIEKLLKTNQQLKDDYENLKLQLI